ncbi:MAG: DUF6279 family lipoprotein [Pseudomonadota bacterium]
MTRGFKSHARLRLGALACACLLLSGCGIKLAYNNADRLMRWWASDYVTFTAEQRAYFDLAFAEVHYWHRTSQLPIYRDGLLRLADALGSDPETALVAFEAEIEGWGETMSARAAPVAIAMLASLSAAQVDDLERRMARSNRDYERDARKPPAAVTREYAKDYADGMKRFVGRLDRDQRALIESRLATLTPDAQAWLDLRLELQSRMLAALRAEPVDRAVLEALMLDFESLYGPELEAIMATNEGIFRRLTVDLLGALTPRQRQHLDDRLREWAQICAELHDEAEPAAPPAAPAAVAT